MAILFVISGYVLSMEPMERIRARDYGSLTKYFAASLFTRWLRLYMPFAITTFLFMTSWYLPGLGAATRPKHASDKLLKEALKWFGELKEYSFVFSRQEKTWFTYNDLMWSLPVEYIGSLVVYTSLLALSHCTRKSRISILLMLDLYFLVVVDGYVSFECVTSLRETGIVFSWYCAFFINGILLCEFENTDMGAETYTTKLSLMLWKGKLLALHLLLAAAFYLGSVPHVTSTSLRLMPGWYYLSMLKLRVTSDPKWFYLFWAAPLLVFTVPRNPWLRRVCESQICQYLGHISFGLYLVHGLVLQTLGKFLYELVGLRQSDLDGGPRFGVLLWISRKGLLGLEFGFLLCQIMLLPLTMWLAEFTTRKIVKPSSTLANFLHKRVEN